MSAASFSVTGLGGSLTGCRALSCTLGLKVTLRPGPSAGRLRLAGGGNSLFSLFVCWTHFHLTWLFLLVLTILPSHRPVKLNFASSYFYLQRQVKAKNSARRGNSHLPLIIGMIELLLLVFVCERESNIRGERRRHFRLLLMLVQQLLTLWWTRSLRVCLEPAPSPVCVFYVFPLPRPHSVQL